MTHGRGKCCSQGLASPELKQLQSFLTARNAEANADTHAVADACAGETGTTLEGRLAMSNARSALDNTAMRCAANRALCCSERIEAILPF
eukprot:scaffold256227_cov21-Tisochrysis_lutea.AAC.1